MSSVYTCSLDSAAARYGDIKGSWRLREWRKIVWRSSSGRDSSGERCILDFTGEADPFLTLPRFVEDVMQVVDGVLECEEVAE